MIYMWFTDDVFYRTYFLLQTVYEYVSVFFLGMVCLESAGKYFRSTFSKA